MTNINNGKILYSLDLNQEIANFLKSKKREIQIKNTMIVNGKIIFFENSFLLKFDLNGKLKSINRRPNKLNTFNYH